MIGAVTSRLSLRLMLSVLAVVVACMVTTVWLVFSRAEDALRASVLDQERLAMESVSDLVLNTLGGVQDHFRMLSRNPSLLAYLDDVNAARTGSASGPSVMKHLAPELRAVREEICRLLETADSTLDSVNRITLLDRSGTVVAATSRENIGGLWKDSPQYLTGMEGKTSLEGPMLSLNGSTPAFVFGVPVWRNAEVAGVLLTNFDLPAMSAEAVSRMSRRFNGRVFVLDNKGLVILHPDSGRLLSRIYADAPFMGHILDTLRGNLTYTLDGTTYLASYGRLRQMLGAPPLPEDSGNPGGLREGSNPGIFRENEPAPILIPDWIVMVSVPLDNAIAAINSLKRSSLIVMGLGLMVMAGVVSLVVLRLTRALTEGVAYAEAVAGGDLDRDFAVCRKDEIGVLASALRKMVATLREHARLALARTREVEAARDELRDKVVEIAMYKDRLEELVASRTRELVRARDEARAATRAKGDFLARMSHEIRTPMNAVIGLSYLCLQTGLTGRQRGYLLKIHSAGSNLLGIINDILDFSKADAGRIVLERIPFRLDTLLRELADLQEDKASQKGLRLRFEVEENVPAALRGDPLRLRQILLNLLSNAVKFTDRGEVRLDAGSAPGAEEARLKKPLGPAECLLLFRVRDTGVGLRPDQIDHLFEAFSQADDSVTRQYGGTGLGLAICKQLVDLYGGRFWVESAPGTGSSFFFTARLEIAAEVDVKPDPARSGSAPDTPLLWKGADPDYGPLSVVAGRRILLVEDNEINVEIALELLRVTGVDVTCAGNGLEALAALGIPPEDGEAPADAPGGPRGAAESCPFDLILMDIQMPVMGGLEATKRIRTRYSRERLPILAMTAHATPGDREKSLEAGMNGHLTKPIDPTSLREALQCWLA